MRSNKTIHVISCHAEGEVGDVIVGGVNPPPGATLWEQRTWIEKDQSLRNFMLNEPRGGVFRHVNLLVPPKNPIAQMGWIIMEPEATPPMSGSNSICVATVLLDSGIIEMHEPITEMILEAPGGLVYVTAECRNGKAEYIRVKNVPAFVGQMGVDIDVPGLGKIKVDTELGVNVTNAANQQLSFKHPENEDWNKFSFCMFAGPLIEKSGELWAKSIVAIQPGKIDRGPLREQLFVLVWLFYGPQGLWMWVMC